MLNLSDFVEHNKDFIIHFVPTIAGVSEEEKKRLLHCVVIGGGPTGVEFSGELSDFIMGDVHQRYSHVKDYIKVTLIEVLHLHHPVSSHSDDTQKVDLLIFAS